MNELENFVVCPYNRHHIVKRHRMSYHIVKCKAKYQDVLLQTCKFNCEHLSREEEEDLHSEGGPAAAKSKKGRTPLGERGNRQNVCKPGGGEPRRESSSSGKEPPGAKSKRENAANDRASSARAGVRNPPPEQVKKKRLNKNPGETGEVKKYQNKPPQRAFVQAFKGKAPPPSKWPAVQSPTFESRNFKKKPKESYPRPVTVKDFYVDRSRRRQGNVSNFSASPAAVLPKKTTKDVYIHYATGKRFVEEDNLPRAESGIQPHMLQKVCWQAFETMNSSPDGSANESPSPVNENLRRTGGVANGGQSPKPSGSAWKNGRGDPDPERSAPTRARGPDSLPLPKPRFQSLKSKISYPSEHGNLSKGDGENGRDGHPKLLERANKFNPLSLSLSLLRAFTP